MKWKSARSCPEADEYGAAIAHGNAKTFTNNYSPVFKVGTNFIYRHLYYFKAVNDGFRNYQWQNDLVEHLYKDIERRVRDPLGQFSLQHFPWEVSHIFFDGVNIIFSWKSWTLRPSLRDLFEKFETFRHTKPDVRSHFWRLMNHNDESFMAPI